MTTTTETAFSHAEGCHQPRTYTLTGKYGGHREACPGCKRNRPISAVRAEELGRRPLVDSLDLAAGSVDWTDLMTKAERRGVPVMRVDEHGVTHIIRSVAQLRADWEG